MPPSKLPLGALPRLAKPFKHAYEHPRCLFRGKEADRSLHQSNGLTQLAGLVHSDFWALLALLLKIYSRYCLIGCGLVGRPSPALDPAPSMQGRA